MRRAFPDRMFDAVKDSLTSRAARKFLAAKFARYGNLDDVRIDSRARRITLDLTLLGETAPTRIVVDNYLLTKVDGETHLTLTQCRCERPWLQHVLEDWVDGKSFPVPGGFLL